MENGKKFGEGEIHNSEATAELVEIIESSDGPSGVYKVEATDEKAKEVLKQRMEQFGGRVEEMPAPKDGKGKSYGFSGVSWNTPWEPKGPKKNWAQNPEAQKARVESLRRQNKFN